MDRASSKTASAPKPVQGSTQVLWLIGALACLVRVIHLWQITDSPTFHHPIIDSETYLEIARALAQRGHMDAAFFWQPYFYQRFLACLITLTHDSLFAIRMIQILVGSATAMLTYRLGLWTGERSVALIAGLIVAFYGPLVFFDLELLATGWSAFWVPALLLLTLKVQHKASLWTALAWGIVIGLSILTRPTFIPPLALLLIGLICSRTFRAIPCWRRAQLLGLTVLAAGLTLLPVMVQSYRHTGEASVLPYSGGINLYIGNNPQSDVTIAMRPGWQWDNLTRLPARFEVPPGRPSSKFFAGQAAAYAREMPADFLLGLWRKSLQLLSPRELPRNIDMYVYRQWSTGLGLMVWKAGPFGFPFGVLLPLAAVGTFMAKRRIPVAITLLSLGYAGAIVLVFVTARYRTPIIPALSIPAAYACVHFWHLGRTRQFVMLTRHLVVMLIISVVISLPGPFPQERNAYEAELHYCLAMQHSRANSLAAAEHELRQALAINPNYADAYNSLGVILERAGDTTQAMSAYSQAVANDASHLTATLNLAGAAYQSGKLEVAADVYAQALALNPQQTTALNRLALIHVKQGQFPLAVERFRQSLGINAQDAAVHNNLGSALNEMKQTDLAIKHFEAAVILAPDMDIAIDNLGAQLTGRGEIGKAIRLYDTVVERAAKLNQRERADRYRVKRDALVQSPASQDVLDTPQSTH